MRKSKIVILSLPLFLLSCAKGKEYFNYSGTAFEIFHTIVSWRYDSPNETSRTEEIKDLLIKMDKLADPYNERKDLNTLYTINHTNDEIEVDPLLFDMIKVSLDYKEKTEGYFDPLIGKITKLWKNTLFEDGDLSLSTFTTSASLVPSLLEEVKNTSVTLNEEKHTVKRIGEAHLDLGGLVKGYAVEMIQSMLKEEESVHYLVNGGQSSISLGEYTDNNGYFSVNLQYSKEKNENSFLLKNTDTSTSAIYEQYQIIGSSVYSHVINPTTGFPETPYSMAFLTGEDSALLDAFSTSIMIAGPDKADEWAAKYNFSYSLYKDDRLSASLVRESPSLTNARKVTNE